MAHRARLGIFWGIRQLKLLRRNTESLPMREPEALNHLGGPDRGKEDKERKSNFARGDC